MATAIKSKSKTEKSWFRLTSNKDIEYSTDFDFFLKNQIAVSKRGFTYNFHSLLEAKSFFITKAVLRTNYEFSDSEIKDKCKEIHNKILQGEFGEGKLVR